MSKHTHVHVVKNQIVRGLKAFGFYILVVFGLFNIFSSQFISEMYLQLLNGEQGAQVEFMKKAKTLPQFKTLKPEIQETYTIYQEEVYADEKKRREYIQKLETIAQSYPESRDVLYSLSLLYEKDGNIHKSQEYLQKAKAIDPNVGK